MAATIPPNDVALIVPVPDAVNDAPVPTTIAAVVLVPEESVENDAEATENTAEVMLPLVSEQMLARFNPVVGFDVTMNGNGNAAPAGPAGQRSSKPVGYCAVHGNHAAMRNKAITIIFFIATSGFHPNTLNPWN